MKFWPEEIRLTLANGKTEAALITNRRKKTIVKLVVSGYTLFSKPATKHLGVMIYAEN